MKERPSESEAPGEPMDEGSREAAEGAGPRDRESPLAGAGSPESDGPPDPQRRRLLAWLWRVPVVAALAGAGYALFEGGRILLGKEPASEDPEFEFSGTQSVASLESFAAEWDASQFTYAGVPALAIRVPEPVPGGMSHRDLHLVAYSRICTHQGCTVSLSRDTEAIAFAYNYRGDTPALACPCHFSIFLAHEAGRAVSGPAVEPLPRVRLELRDESVVATGIERPS